MLLIIGAVGASPFLRCARWAQLSSIRDEESTPRRRLPLAKNVRPDAPDRGFLYPTWALAIAASAVDFVVEGRLDRESLESPHLHAVEGDRLRFLVELLIDDKGHPVAVEALVRLFRLIQSQTQGGPRSSAV